MLLKCLTIFPTALLLAGAGCQKKISQKAGERQKSEQGDRAPEEDELEEESPDDSDDALPDAEAAKPHTGGDEEEEKPKETAEPDPDARKVRVVFHFSRSGVWKSEEQMQDVTKEVQRILGQAKLLVEAKYTEDDQSDQTDLDVFFVPSIGGSGTNGISFGGRQDDIQVRDDVRLGKVADDRPETAGLDPNEAEQARTIAHETCHQLGLPHRQNQTNLMASGTTGWTLNENEIATVRAEAERRFGR